MIDFHTYCRVQELRCAKGISIAKTASLLSLDPRTVSKWAKKERYEPRYTPRRARLTDPFIERIQTEIILGNNNSAAILRQITAQGYTGSYTLVQECVASLRKATNKCQIKQLLPIKWMLGVLQNGLPKEILFEELDETITPVDLDGLLTRVREGDLRERNRALAVLASAKGIKISDIAEFLMLDQRTVTAYVSKFRKSGLRSLFSFERDGLKKHELPEYKDALFSILHSPPRDHGINRTSWRMIDLKLVMHNRGLHIGEDCIRKIVKNAGFAYRKAKKVLTSTDPAYKERLETITDILSELSQSERFFSIDEYGPVAIKIHGGKSLTAPDEKRVVPQYQKNKGSLILIGALELSSNQMIHFYAEHKRTKEMIQLLHLLLSKYQNQKKFYFSWDAASWHTSKRFLSEVDRINSKDYRTEKKTPEIAIAPLPSCAQFLNVIESVFSGMARAIIHNSDYESVDECKKAMNLYFAERNQHFNDHPKRAGNKIWGKERTPPVFSETNNCKDPIYR
jgi:transposase